MSDDRKLDFPLCDVPLPDGLLARLRQIAVADAGAIGPEVASVGERAPARPHKWDSAAIDAALRRVPLPNGLRSRLRRIAVNEALHVAAGGANAADWDAAAIDTALCRVSLPGGWAARLAGVRPRVARRVSPGMAALAASLAVAIGMSYLSSLAGFVLSSHGALSDSPPPLLAEQAVVEWLPAVERPFTATTHAASVDVGPAFEPLDLRASTAGLSPDVYVPTPPDETPPEDRWLAAAEAARADAALDGFPRYAFHQDANVDPAGGDRSLAPRGRGIEPPPLAGLDQMAWEATGVHPAVSPAVDPRLQVSHVPVDVDSAGYEAVRQTVRDGLLPPPTTVRVEDFIAALRYRRPPPVEAGLALESALGPSPFGDEGLRLLRVGLQAAELPAAPRQGTHLTLVVDVSASMRQGGRLEIVREALIDLAGWLDPHDRVSLIVFDSEADVLLRGVTVEQASALAEAAGMLGAGGATNFSVGLRTAFAVAEEEWLGAGAPSNVARRVVLVSDGGATLQRDVLRRIEDAVASLARDGYPLSVVDVAQRFDPDAQLARLSVAGGGRLHHAATLAHVRRALREELSGGSQTVARDVRMSVTFNPKSVLLYRLLGHEATAGLPAARPAADLHSGQGADGLYELLLVPEGEELLAEVRVQWRDAATDQERETRRSIHRGQIANSFAECAPALQAAALAAETAELLRGSYFARGGSWGAVLDAASQADSALQQTAAFRDWLSFLRDVQQARPAEPRSRRNPSGRGE